MTTRTALFTLLALWGVSAFAGASAVAEETASSEAQAGQTPLKRSFTNRVWVKDDAGSDLPGVMRIFLSDGTLVQDSCWETHRLSNWSMSGEASLRWDEDGMEIPATIVSVSSTELHLQLQVGNDTVDEHYVAATVPYVCPDIPR